jgi:hypothetical protein
LRDPCRRRYDKRGFESWRCARSCSRLP